MTITEIYVRDSRRCLRAAIALRELSRFRVDIADRREDRDAMRVFAHAAVDSARVSRQPLPLVFCTTRPAPLASRLRDGGATP